MKELNEEKVISRFQQMIRKKTVSDKGEDTYKEEFDSFYKLLEENYPAVYGKVENLRADKPGILIKWKGKNEKLDPVILMGHHDVVSDEGQEWLHPAFEAEIHDGCIWGRGTIDTKCLIGGVFEAWETLINEGFTPERDIYFASSDCEEVAGKTMPEIAQWFKENKIKPHFILDEGGAIMSNLPMGIKTPFAMIAMSEKGWAKLKLTARSKTAAHGAKASASDKISAPVKLVKALDAIEKNPVEANLTPVVEEMLRSFAPYIDGYVGSVLKNIKIFRPIIKKVLESNADTAAMIRSAINITKIEAGNEKGSVPDTASAVLSLKIAPHDTVDGVIEHIKKVVGENIEVEEIKRSDPPRISDFTTNNFELVKNTVKKVFPDVGAAPFILNAGTDARHFSPICNEIYRFGAFRLNDDLFDTVHGANERMPIKDYFKCIEFYYELIKGIK